MPMFRRSSPRRVFQFDEASASSAERNPPRERRIFEFDEESLNSTESSSIPTTTASSVRTTTDRSESSIVEDHPGLHATDERVVDFQAAIHEEMKRFMIGRDPHEVMAAAERIHGESNDPEFLQSQLDDLVLNGPESEAFQIGVETNPGAEALPANPGEEALPANPGAEALPANGDFLGGIGDCFFKSPLAHHAILAGKEKRAVYVIDSAVALFQFLFVGQRCGPAY